MQRSAAIILALCLFWGGCSAATPASFTSPGGAPSTTLPPTTSVDGPTTTVVTPGVAPSGLRTRKAGVLIVGTERVTPPWFIGPQPELVSGGFEFDVASELARRLGVPAVEVIPTSLVLLMGGEDCGCDLIISGITITDSRARTLDLSEPYLSADQGVLARKATTITTPASAAALRWAIALRNARGLDLLQSSIKPTIEPTVVVNEDEAVRQLSLGHVDAVLMDAPAALAVANTNPDFAVIGQYKTGEQYSMALSLGTPNTPIINDAIREMREDGTIDMLTRAYFGIDPSKLPVLSP